MWDGKSPREAGASMATSSQMKVNTGSQGRRRRRSPETGQSTQANSNSRLTQLPPPFRQSRPGSRPPPRSKQSGHRFQHQNIGVNPHEDPPPAYTAPENAHEPQLNQKKKKEHREHRVASGRVRKHGGSRNRSDRRGRGNSTSRTRGGAPWERTKAEHLNRISLLVGVELEKDFFCAD